MSTPNTFTRRQTLGLLAGLGIGTTAFHHAVAGQAAQGIVTPEAIKQAERITGIELSEEERLRTAAAVNQAVENYRRLRKVSLANSVPPAIDFNPAPWLPPTRPAERTTSAQPTETHAPKRPESDEDLAFLPLTELSPLVRTRRVTSTELTRLYLNRLKRYDPLLKCVVTLTPELALKQAKRADEEIAAGRYRGPLHGIPWGAKDLIAVPGYPTTWGAPQFREQMLPEKATVVRKLEAAGAVLVAKLSLGALAQGDKWFGGRTNCPWNPRVGSSGSSAGSAAATAAGCVGFSLGSETLGSIVSPCRRNGTTGLRPTFGRVSRHGCMTLAWSMDKIGPIARSAEDCALIFAALHGFDGQDPSAVTRPFAWPVKRDVSTMTVGYFQRPTPENKREELNILKEMGVQLRPIKLPDTVPFRPLAQILYTEAGTVFDELTRTNNLEGLNSWPPSFRKAQFVPAVEYIRANRIRTLLQREMRKLMAEVDCYVNGQDLTLTNLTGHPTVVLPIGFRQRSGEKMPYSVTFTGRLYGEAELLTVAHAFQQHLTAHLKQPPLEKWLQPEQ